MHKTTVFGPRRTLLLRVGRADGLVDFPPVDRHVSWGLDPQLGPVALDFDQRDYDVAVNDDTLRFFRLKTSMSSTSD